MATWEPAESDEVSGDESWDDGTPSDTSPSPSTPTGTGRGSRLGDSIAGDRRASTDSTQSAGSPTEGGRIMMLGDGGRSQSWNARSIHGLRQPVDTDTDPSTPRAPARKRHLKLRAVALAVRAFLALLPRAYFVSDVVWEKTAEGKKALKAGTMATLIEAIAAEEGSDADMVRDVLLTYRYFTTPDELFNRLVERFRQRFAPGSKDAGKASNVPLRVINAIRRWLKEFFYDFQEAPRLLERVTAFIDSDVATCPDASIVKWVEPLKKIIAEQSANRAQPSPLLPASGPLAAGNGVRRGSQQSSDIYVRQAIETSAAAAGLKRPDRTYAELLKISPTDLFRQLTLMEHELFLQITPADIYYKSSKDVAKGGRRLTDMIDHFNKISFWVAKEICGAPNLKQRVSFLKLFVHLAYICLENRNYNTCLEVVAGLTMTFVQRLKKLWKSLPSKYANMWRDVQKVMTPRQNYAAYREVLKTATTPMFPYFGIFLTDVATINDKYPTFLGHGNLINFSKLRMISAVLLDMQRVQSTTPFTFAENPVLRRFVLYDIDLTDDDTLYRLSKAAENADESSEGKETISQRIGKSFKPVVFKEARSSSLPDMYADLVRLKGNTTPPQ